MHKRKHHKEADKTYSDSQQAAQLSATIRLHPLQSNVWKHMLMMASF